jgi:hypothetical protein
MNRKNEVSALLSKARTAAQRGDYAGYFQPRQRADIVQSIRRSRIPQSCRITPHVAFCAQKIGS